MDFRLSEKLVRLYLKKGDITKWFLVKSMNFPGFLLLVFLVLLIIPFAITNISNVYSLIPFAIMILIYVVNKKLIIHKINFYSSIIIDYLNNRNPNIPDILFENLYSEIESFRTNIKSEELNVFDLYLVYLKFFIQNKFHDNPDDTGSTISFIQKSIVAFSTRNINSLPHTITSDFSILKKSKNKKVVKDTLFSIIKYNLNFNMDIMIILRHIHDKLNKQPPNRVKKSIKYVFNRPVKTILFIFIILLIIYIILSFLKKDVSKITPLFDPINNLMNSIYCTD